MKSGQNDIQLTESARGNVLRWRASNPSPLLLWGNINSQQARHPSCSEKMARMLRAEHSTTYTEAIYQPEQFHEAARPLQTRDEKLFDVCFQSDRFSCSREEGLLTVSPTVMNLWQECMILLNETFLTQSPTQRITKKVRLSLGNYSPEDDAPKIQRRLITCLCSSV